MLPVARAANAMSIEIAAIEATKAVRRMTTPSDSSEEGANSSR